jgi:virginiamycin B lyase
LAGAGIVGLVAPRGSTYVGWVMRTRTARTASRSRIGRLAAVFVLAGAVTACTATPAPTTPPTSAAGAPAGTASPESAPRLETFPVPAGAHPHDVAPAIDGGVWFTAQRAGYLGHLSPATGAVTQVSLGSGSAPHGVIVGPDDAAWVTDGGLNAIVRVDAATRAVTRYPLPAGRANANLNTATFDHAGVLWFTGQAGVYGRLDPGTGAVQVFDAPGGRGPYGITTTPAGDVYYASLAASHIARIDTATGAATVLQPPTPDQGARRVWSDSAGRIWVSEWNAGRLGRYDPGSDAWTEWPMPGDGARAYSVFVDDQDKVWLSDFGANALVRFDPQTDTFTSLPLPGAGANVRQMLGRPGEVWGAASGLDMLVLVRTGG